MSLRLPGAGRAVWGEALRRRESRFDRLNLNNWRMRSAGELKASGRTSASSRHGVSVLALVTDAHGGFGGISQYNRDALEAMASFSTVDAVHVVPRLADERLGPLPEKVHYDLSGLGGRVKFTTTVFRRAWQLNRADLIFCGHINLAPTAKLAAFVTGAPVVLSMHGVDAWAPPNLTPIVLIRRTFARFLSVSELTRDRFVGWSRVRAAKVSVVPNTVRPEAFRIRSRNELLATRLGLQGKTVLLTLGRMASEERAKGFDEVIELLPRLIEDIPNLVYLAVGDGSDRTRLEAKVARLGLQARVIFTGRVDDTMKADLYQLSDVYVMPSRGEGFGIVILEALASGVPVVASASDGTREAVRGGQLGVLVDPDDPESIRRGIHEALQRPRGVPETLEYFNYENFSTRLRSALREVCDI